jgi:asparagine synthase (glutamine-hydrolysing)
VCGISGVVGPGVRGTGLEAVMVEMRHRGPDDSGTYLDPAGRAWLGHLRLSIIDLSAAGRGPMSSADGSCWISFNGEVYNYVELRAELADYPYRSQTDTEVVLAAYQRWGPAFLDRLVGMFAFALWDERTGTLLAARDRFGVKPLYHASRPDGTLLLASEVGALHAAGVPAEPDPVAWATYLASGLSDHGERTFWEGVRSLPPGHLMTWRDGRLDVRPWYDLAERTAGDLDDRPRDEVVEEYRALLEESVRLRFRSDVPVGINLSGGLDSSTLLGVVQAIQGAESDVAAFTFVTGDARYDELPWVEQMLERTRHPSVVVGLDPAAVPDLAASVMRHEQEPFGGIPTIAYARLFEAARERGVLVLMDGQGMDEQWAGYDYYAGLADLAPPGGPSTGPVQGTGGPAVRPDCLSPDFHALAEPLWPPVAFPDALRQRQYVDARYTKIPRALRFNDRVSMRASTELREPFLDHRLFELAMRQPPERKIAGGRHKVMLREVAAGLLPDGVVEAPKRPLQTPQREWLRGPLADWAEAHVEAALDAYPDWLDGPGVRAAWSAYCSGAEESSFHVWQWLSLGLWHQVARPRSAARTGGSPLSRGSDA